MTISKTVTLTNTTNNVGDPKGLSLENLSGSVGILIPPYGSVTEDLYTLQLSSNISDVLSSWITAGSVIVALDGVVQTANQVQAWKYSLDSIISVSTLQSVYQIGNTIVTTAPYGSFSVSGTEAVSLSSSGASIGIGTSEITFNDSSGAAITLATLRVGGGAGTIVSTASYTVQSDDLVVLVDYTTTGIVTITIPSAEIAILQRTITVIDIGDNASVNNIIINTEGAETISGETNAIIDIDNATMEFISDGTNLFVK